MDFPLVILGLLFLLTIVRRFGSLRLQLWQIMLVGAAAVLVSGDIAPLVAIRAVDWEVMLFLFGMFIIATALERSGLLFFAAYHLLRRARSIDALLLLLLIITAAASALVMNDTLAVVGTPLVLLLAREHGIPPKLLLLALAFAVTLGSVASPIGNPQNLLIALHGDIGEPFTTFFGSLFLPSLLNLFIAYGLLRLFYWKDFHSHPLQHQPVELRDRSLALLAGISVLLVIVLVLLRIGLMIWQPQIQFPLSTIAILAALPLLLFSKQRKELLRELDWHTLLFFIGLFILMRAVWDTGVFQTALAEQAFDPGSIPGILGVSVLLSQLISNVPLVALYLPLLPENVGPEGLLALAAGSTVAGNLLLLGAASNIIIAQGAERREGVSLGFWEFARVGLPLTAINVLVYWWALGA